MFAESIDVVTLAKNMARKLPVTCEAIRQHVPVRKHIFVVGRSHDDTKEIAKSYADTLVGDDRNLGVGYARSLGLREVETELYASIDADVIVGRDWFQQCAKSIEEPLVAASQGYAHAIGKHYRKWQEVDTIRTRRYVSLGNTLLRTNAVNEVGMPLNNQGDDYILRDRLISRGYRWVTLFNLVSVHNVDDVEMVTHYVRYGRTERPTFSNLYMVMREKWGKGVLGVRRYGVATSLYIALLGVAWIYGSLFWSSHSSELHI